MYKSGFISIVGRPNAGKSTLLNRVLGEKIAAVSPKPQTTRTQIMGVITDEKSQMVFVDTPGIHKPKNKLGQFMAKEVERGTGHADVVLYLVDCSHYQMEQEQEIVAQFDGGTVFLVLNKVDKLPKNALLPMIAQFKEVLEFAEIVPISAKTGDGVDHLLTLISDYLPEGPQFFPEDTLTDQPERQICAELIREKLMHQLNEEIPYGVAVVIEKMQEQPEKNLTSITATIFCERDSHKAIIIGKHGDMLKKIGTQARHDLERFTQTKVFLQLWVKVKENWRNSDLELKHFGYEQKK